MDGMLDVCLVSEVACKMISLGLLRRKKNVKLKEKKDPQVTGTNAQKGVLGF